MACTANTAAFVLTLRVTNIGRVACSAAQGLSHAVLLLLFVQSQPWCTAAKIHTCSTGGWERLDWLLHAGCEQLPCQSGYIPAGSQTVSAGSQIVSACGQNFGTQLTPLLKSVFLLLNACGNKDLAVDSLSTEAQQEAKTRKILNAFTHYYTKTL